MTYITTLLTGLYILIMGATLGKKLLPNATLKEQLPVGVVSLFGIFSIILTILFYLIPLTPIIYIAVIFLISAFIQYGICFIPRFKFPKVKLTLPHWITIIYYISLAILVRYIYNVRTMELTTSVWELFSSRFYIILLISIISLLYITIKQEIKYKWIHLSVFIALILNISNIIYPLGFGFDGFIHRATEQLLIQGGTISPKPLYYIGHYVLVALLNLTSGIPIELIDRTLPTLILIIVLGIIAQATKIIFSEHKPFSSLAVLSILILPLNLLINPTPLALSLILTIGAVWYAVGVLFTKQSIYPLLIITLFSLCVHPLSGIASLIITAFVFNHKIILPRYKTFSKYINILIAAVSSIALPLAFWLMSILTSVNQISFTWTRFSLKELIRFPYINQLNFPLDLVYGAMNIIPLIFLLLIVSSGIKAIRNKEYKWLFFIATSLALIINAFILLSFIRLGNIIDYEQKDFALRLISISFFAGWPAMIYALRDITARNNYQKVFLTFTFTVLVASNIYISFPRRDEYQNEKFINLTKYDVTAVNEVQSRNQNTSYAVLTNQVVSSAAVKQFGLDHTITASDNQNIYFYSIPTGGSLYQYYLRLVNGEDVSAVIEEAKNFTQTKKIVVIMTPTWKNFDQLDVRFKSVATATYDIEGKMFVYEFE